MEKKITEVLTWYQESEQYKEKSITSQKRDDSIIKTLKRYFRSKSCKGNVLSWDEHPKRLNKNEALKLRRKLEHEGKANDTIKKYMRMCCNSIIQAGIWADWDLPNPFIGLDTRLPTQVRDRIATPEEIKKITIALPEPYRGVFLFQGHTGMRIGEVLGLTWDRVDFADRLAWFEPEHHKTGRSGHVSKPVAVMLPEEALEVIRGRVKQGQFVFHSNGNRVRYPAWGKRFIAAQKQAGILEEWDRGENGRRLQSKDIRRTFATAARNRGVPIEAISAQLKHATTQTTQRIYARSNHEIAKPHF